MGVIIRNGIEYSGTGTGGSNIEYLTQAQYDALSDDKLTNGVEYRITDAGTMAGAENVGYNNSKSGIEAVNVQDAIDKLDESLVNNVIKYIDINATTDSYGTIQLNLDDYPMASPNKFINAICCTRPCYLGHVAYFESLNCLEIRIVDWSGNYNDDAVKNANIALRILYTDNMSQTNF